jgi:two-component sensor histidine kinase
MVAVNASNISAQELLHAVNNQLAVIMGHADMLAKEANSEQALERCREIKRAASKINVLLQEFPSGDKDRITGAQQLKQSDC